MKYRITIEEVVEPHEVNDSYTRHVQVYQQTIEGLRVRKLVTAINGGEELDDWQQEMAEKV